MRQCRHVFSFSSKAQDGYDYAPPPPEQQLKPSRPPRPETASGVRPQAAAPPRPSGGGGGGHHHDSDDPLAWLRESVPGDAMLQSLTRYHPYATSIQTFTKKFCFWFRNGCSTKPPSLCPPCKIQSLDEIDV